MQELRYHRVPAPQLMRELCELFPRVFFHFENGELTVLYPQGASLPKSLRFEAHQLIEVRPDSLSVVKDLGAHRLRPSEAVVEMFQRCTGLTPDGILGAATKQKMRDIAVISHELATKPLPLKPKSAWQRLMEDD